MGQRYDRSQKWQGSFVHERFDLGLTIRFTKRIKRQPPGKSMKDLVMIVKVDITVKYVLHLPLPNTCTSHNVRISTQRLEICMSTTLPLAFGAQLTSAQAPAGTVPTYVPHTVVCACGSGLVAQFFITHTNGEVKQPIS